MTNKVSQGSDGGWLPMGILASIINPLIKDYVEKHVMTKVNELAETLNAETAKVEKIRLEVVAVKAALSELELPPEAVEALAQLEAALNAVDDLNPDAVAA